MFQDSLQGKVTMVILDEFSRVVSAKVSGMSSLLSYIFFAVRYFPPTSSNFALHGYFDENLYQDLYANIIQYTALQEVILFEDFNAHTKS
jgi:hypothetical protein